MTWSIKAKNDLLWWSVLALCWVPMLALMFFVFNDDMGANPITSILRYLGDWSIRFLVIGLALSPLRKLTKWTWPIRIRRLIGVVAFFYVLSHFVFYIAIDQFFDWDAIWKDVLKRPFITLGFVPFLLLMPLAITSTNGMVRRLGFKLWQNLHKLIYLIVPLGVLHYWLLVKVDTKWPWIYGGLTVLFLLYRGYLKFKQKAKYPLVKNTKSV